MTKETPETLRARTLADWQELADDEGKLRAGPETQWRELTEQAQKAFDQGVIDADGLRELLEYADAAYSYVTQ